MNLFCLIVPGGDTAGEEDLAERISSYLNSAKMKEQARLNMSRDLNAMYNKLFAFKVKNEELDKVLILVKKERSDYQTECEKLKEELKEVKQQSDKFKLKSEELQRDVDMFEVKNKELEKVLMSVKKERLDNQDECKKLKEKLKEVKQQSNEFKLKSEELQREVDMFQQKESCKCTVHIMLCIGVAACATNLPLACTLS